VLGHAATWTGAVDNQYLTPGNWDGNAVPNTGGGATAQINSGTVEYNPGGDLFVNNGGTLEINGGSFEQTSGAAWMQFAGGNLVVAGGSFSQGTSENIVKDAGTTVTVSAGSASFSLAGGDYALGGSSLNISGGTTDIGPNAGDTSGRSLILNSGSFAMSGGILNVSNEFKPLGATASISGGTLNARLISFDSVDTVLEFSGGNINLAVATFQGVFSGGNGHIDFTDTDATLFITGGDQATADSLLNGRLRANGVIDANQFDVSVDGSGVSISLVPEPGSLALLAIGGLLIARRRRD
jgi:hypothetical protein